MATGVWGMTGFPGADFTILETRTLQVTGRELL